MNPERRARAGRGLLSACLACLLLHHAPPLLAESEPEVPIDFNADHLDIDNKNQRIEAKGKVQVSQPGRMELSADEASYVIDKRVVHATGNVRMERNGDLFTSDKLELDIENRTGSMEKPVADLKGPGGHVAGEHVDFLSQDHYLLRNATYTNCDCEPGAKPSWELTAREVDLDREANTMTAKDVHLRLGDVPVMWVPWWRHPLLPKRQSGLLFPTMRAAGGNGFEADIPYYWDIAPNRDATLTLHPTSRRGMLTKVQYRYMGTDYRGQLDTQNIYDSVEERHRGLTLFQHQQNVGSWALDARLANSQTRDFLHDFPQKKLIDPRERRLESHLEADRLWLRKQGYSNFQTGTAWYQNLDAANDRYTVQRLPYMSFTDDRPLHALGRVVEGNALTAGHFQLHGDYKFDSFYQLSGDAAQRLDLAPELQYWRALPIGHVSGALGLRQTSYLMQGDPNQTGAKDPSESREAASLRLRLDMDLARSYGGGAYKHTLEPAIQYAMLSSSNQSGLPNFDSTLRHFSVGNLFDGNLYSGDDRLSAGQWVAYGLTSRLFGRQGSGDVRNLVTLTVGQRWAPEGDREYQRNHTFSDVVSGVEWNLTDHWTVSLGNRYDQYDNTVRSMDTALSYSDASSKVAIGYHRNRPETELVFLTEGSTEPVEEVTLQASWRAREHWRFKQDADYSLETSGLKSWRSGIAYDHSCWSIELSGGRELSSQTNKHGGGFIGLYFILKGLGGYGVSS
ncbi:MAG: LPS-assembly protein LptD [Magnetococcales bacterium]|nr:LPS-assembly protein LptD [Magnetococcales bacterium]